MTSLQKKIFIIASISLPFLAYCFYYYGMMVRNAPYKFSEFDHISIQYGTPDSMLNSYNSKTGAYQYLNDKDSVVKTNMHVRRDSLLTLHRTAADLGFWNFPVSERGDSIKAGHKKPVRYIVEFAYKRKTKRVVFDSDFKGDSSLVDANERLVKKILTTLNNTQDMLKNLK